MRWAVAYYEGSLPLVWRDSQEFAWSALPPGDGVTTGVLWVDTWFSSQHIGLAGMDNYWLSGMRVGMFNDLENFDWYEGKQVVSWRFFLDGSASEDLMPHAGVNILRGIMLPDDVWAEALRYRHGH